MNIIEDLEEEMRNSLKKSTNPLKNVQKTKKNNEWVKETIKDLKTELEAINKTQPTEFSILKIWVSQQKLKMQALPKNV